MSCALSYYCKYKVSLARCFNSLVNRALRICSDIKLSEKLEFRKRLQGMGIRSVSFNRFVSRGVGRMDVGEVNTGQRVVFRPPYVGKRHCDLESRVRSQYCSPCL